jgi:hypothetical protein
MAHFSLDLKAFKSLLTSENFSYGQRLVSLERILRTFLHTLQLDYDTIFWPCERELHKLRDKAFLREYYKLNLNA